MNRKITLLVLFLTAVALGWVPDALGGPVNNPVQYLTDFRANYSSAVGTRIDQCLLCHTNSFGGARNPYGTHYEQNGHNFTTIELLDSDVDGFTNIDEINNRSFPGEAIDFPSILTSIVVSPPAASLTVSRTQMFNATARNQNNISMSGVVITWASNDTAVGTVAPLTSITGLDGIASTTFTAVAAGDAMVTATNNTVMGSANATVTTVVVPALTTITVSPSTSSLAVNGTQMFTATAMDQNNNPMAGINITWASNNTTVGNIDPINAATNASGMATTTFTASTEGTAMVTATNNTVIGTSNVTVTAAPASVVTSFLLTPDTSIVLKGTTININAMALNGNLSMPDFNGMADINITANNLSAVGAPMNVSFVNGNATIHISSTAAQFVTVTATNGTITGSTTVEFADFVIQLVKGWNLVSIPSFANPSNINQTLLLVQNNGVQAFNPDTMLFVTPTDLQPLYGYWINVTADDQKLGFIADTSDIIRPPTRNLFEGWNLIGVSASRTPDTVNAGMLFVSLKYGNHFTEQYYSELVIYDEAQTPKTLAAGENDLTDLTDNTPLEKGRGYWLFIKNIPNTNENNVPWAGKTW